MFLKFNCSSGDLNNKSDIILFHVDALLDKKLKEYNVPYEMVPYEDQATAKMDHAGKLEVQSALHMSLELRIR